MLAVSKESYYVCDVYVDKIGNSNCADTINSN